MKVAHKLTLAFCIMVFLVGLIGYIAADSSQKALRISIGKGMEELASEVLNTLDTEILDKIEAIESYAADQLLIGFLIDENNKFEKLADIKAYVTQQDNEWVSAPIETTTPFMRDFLGNRLSKELQEKVAFYNERYGYKVFGEIFVTNRYGANVAMTNKTSDYRQDDEDWWQEARLEGLHVKDKIERDESAGNILSITISKRIDDDNGEFLGVLKAVLNIQLITEFMAELEQRARVNEGYGVRNLSLLTKDGIIIYSSEYEVLQDVSKIFPALILNGENKGTFIQKRPHANSEDLVAYAYSKGRKKYKGFGWIMVLETAKAFAPVDNLKRYIKFSVIGIAVFVALLSFMIFVPLSRAISRLKIATFEIGQGNLDVRCGNLSNDEIGELSKAFDKMAIRLKEYQENFKAVNSELKTANGQLMAQSRELVKKSQNTAFINELLKNMQACISSEEALSLIAKYGQQIFPDDSAVLYRFNESRNSLEARIRWGDNTPLEDVLYPEDCWALRKGKMHTVTDGAVDIRCPHVEKDFCDAHWCIPMLAKNTVTGLLHVRPGKVETGGDERKSKEMLLSSFTELTALALQNLDLQDHLKMLSVRDPRTGLFNVRYMEETLERELIRAGRNKKSLGIILYDIDHFKVFNDTFGHDAGDAVLKSLSQILSKNLRGSDIVCRYGGEEFLIVLPDCTEKITVDKAEYIKTVVKELNLVHNNQSLGTVTLSGGVAIFPDHGSTRDAIIKAADNALYAAKKSGRDCVVVATTRMTEELQS